MLTPETLQDIQTRLKLYVKKSLCWLFQEASVSQATNLRATKSLKYNPSKTSMVHHFQPTYPILRINLCSVFRNIHDDITDSPFLFMINKAWFHLSGRTLALYAANARKYHKSHIILSHSPIQSSMWIVFWNPSFKN